MSPKSHKLWSPILYQNLDGFYFRWYKINHYQDRNKDKILPWQRYVKSYKLLYITSKRYNLNGRSIKHCITFFLQKTF